MTDHRFFGRGGGENAGEHAGHKMEENVFSSL